MSDDKRARVQIRDPRPIAGRVPPNDPVAEDAVLSAVLSDNDAADAVIVVLEPKHFYSEQHQLIFQAVTELRTAGIRVDYVTVNSWLHERDLVQRAGGVEALARLVDATPAIPHVMQHAKDVHECWHRRRIIAVCQTFEAHGYDSVLTHDQYVSECDIAITAALSVKMRRAESERLSKTLATVIAKLNDPDDDPEVRSTGLRDLDLKLGGGLFPGDLTIIAARPGMGKAQPYDAKVFTPTGWRPMGSLSVGDEIIGADGLAKRVTGIYEKGELDAYRVTMSDGASTECCGDHLWLTRNRQERRSRLPGSVRNTRDIAATMNRCDSGGLNHSTPYMAPARLVPLTEALPLDPYLLGLYLGDGSSSGNASIDNPEIDIRERIGRLIPPTDHLVMCSDGLHMRIRAATRTGRPSATKQALRSLGLSGLRSWEKFIPEMYLRATVADRVRLLQGLCDTDGYVTQPRLVQYVTTSPRLMAGMEFLVGSLGGLLTWKLRNTHYLKDGKRVPCRAAFHALLRFPAGDIVPVSSAKHLAKWASGPMRITERFIASVDAIGPRQCRCISVDDSLYVTDGFIVTHNTSLLDQIEVSIADSYGCEVVSWTGEMPKEQRAMRKLCARAKIDISRFRSKHLRSNEENPELDEWAMLAHAGAFLARLAIEVDETPLATLGHVSSFARRRHRRAVVVTSSDGKERTGLGAITGDHIGIMGTSDRGNRNLELGEISCGLKALAKELHVPVVWLCQLNRGVESRPNKRPTMADLRECGKIEEDADNIILLYRQEYYEPGVEVGVAEFNIAKQRNGQTGVVKVAFQKECTRFSDLAHDHQNHWSNN